MPLAGGEERLREVHRPGATSRRSRRRSAHSRCSGRGGRRACRRSRRARARPRERRSSAAIRIPGVQKPHWSAWWRWNASCSGVSAVPPASDSTVSHARSRRPARRAGSSRARRRRRAARCTRRRRRARSRRACPSGRARWRRKSVRSRRGSTYSRTTRAVDGQRDLDHEARSISARSTRVPVSCAEVARPTRASCHGGSTSARASAPASRAPRRRRDEPTSRPRPRRARRPVGHGADATRTSRPRRPSRRSTTATID